MEHGLYGGVVENILSQPTTGETPSILRRRKRKEPTPVEEDLEPAPRPPDSPRSYYFGPVRTRREFDYVQQLASRYEPEDMITVRTCHPNQMDNRSIAHRLRIHSIDVDLKTYACAYAMCGRQFDCLQVLAWHVSYSHHDATSPSQLAAFCFVCGHQMQTPKGKNSHLLSKHRMLSIEHHRQCLQQQQVVYAPESSIALKISEKQQQDEMIIIDGEQYSPAEAELLEEEIVDEEYVEEERAEAVEVMAYIEHGEGRRHIQAAQSTDRVRYIERPPMKMRRTLEHEDYDAGTEHVSTGSQEQYEHHNSHDDPDPEHTLRSIQGVEFMEHRRGANQLRNDANEEQAGKGIEGVEYVEHKQEMEARRRDQRDLDDEQKVYFMEQREDEENAYIGGQEYGIHEEIVHEEPEPEDGGLRYSEGPDTNEAAEDTVAEQETRESQEKFLESSNETDDR